MVTRSIRSPVLLAATLALTACAGRPEKPEEAILRARNPDLEITWATPDTRVPPFEKVMLAPVELDFRPVPPVAGPPGTAGSTRTDYPVTERDRERIAETVGRIFREELAESTAFELTDEPGPGVLLVKPALRDIVSHVPPEEYPGRSDIYLDSVGDATLVVDFVDAETGRALGITSDRRTAEPVGAIGGFGGVRANRVEAGQEVRRLARRWGLALKRRLEQLYFEAKPR
jgi:hypothetical protein